MLRLKRGGKNFLRKNRYGKGTEDVLRRKVTRQRPSKKSPHVLRGEKKARPVAGGKSLWSIVIQERERGEGRDSPKEESIAGRKVFEGVKREKGGLCIQVPLVGENTADPGAGLSFIKRENKAFEKGKKEGAT